MFAGCLLFSSGVTANGLGFFTFLGVFVANLWVAEFVSRFFFRMGFYAMGCALHLEK